MLSWFKSEKKQAQEKAERDARMRAELAIKARQFDEENKHRFEAASEVTDDEPSDASEETTKTPGSKTIYDISTRTSFNF